MVRLDDLALFVRSAALGSFSNAAREAGLLPGQVSAAIQRLERELDVRLFARSTRSLRLTAEGERYLQHAGDALHALQADQEQLRGEDTQLQGVLQVSAPSDLGRNVLLSWLTEFRREHSALTLRMHVSDQLADVFRDPVDVAIRYGHMQDASYVAMTLLADNYRVLVAAPAYVERHGAPQSLEELSRHACLCYTLGGRVHDRWLFPAPGNPRRSVLVSGVLVSDDAELVRRWAVAGEGIAYKSWLDVCDDVRAGRLQVLLPDVPGEACPLQLVCPHRRQYSPAVQRLYQWLRLRCEQRAGSV